MKRKTKNKKAIKETNKETLEKKTFIEKIDSHKKIITMLIGLLPLLYPIINTVYNIIYQNKCEEFYALPGKYFSSSVDNNIFYFICILILISLLLSPFFIKKYDEKKGNTSKDYLLQAIFMSILFGTALGMINVLNLVEIMKHTHKISSFFRIINEWLDKKDTLTVNVVILLGIVSVLGITMLSNIRHIKQKWIKNIIFYFLTVSFVVSLLLLLYGTFFKLNITIEDKIKYEFVTLDNNEYVVLSTYDDKILIVPFEISEDGVYIFKTKQYCFEELYKGKYEYRDIKKSPMIDLGQ